LPVILMSAHYNDELRQTAIDEGAVDVLYKPFDATELLKIIQSALINSQEK
jgi:FixJ family two-component response regulator